VSAAPRVQNPYLAEYKRLNPTLKDPLDFIEGCDFALFEKLHAVRESFVKKYSWAIPNAHALEAIAKCSPLVEMGAGTGYWASLLRAMGVDVVAYDEAPPGNGSVSRNKYHLPFQYTTVVEGGPNVLWAHSDRALFLCWPPYDDPFAFDSVNLWGGNVLVFVGEGSGGCTGCDTFHDKLREQFLRRQTVEIPTWPGIRDCLTIWHRKSTLGAEALEDD
jgi:hypothetical protein